MLHDPVLKDAGAYPPLVVDAAAQHRISLDPEVVASNPDTFEFELPDGRRLEANRLHFQVYNPNWRNWSGLVHSSVFGYVDLTYHGHSVTGILNLDDARYQITAFGSEHRLVRLAEHGVTNCGVGKILLGRDLNPDPRLQPLLRPMKDLPTREHLSTKAGNAQIDVLAVYVDDFLPGSTEEQNLFSYIQSSISIANNVFLQSEVAARYNLVAMRRLTGTDQPQGGTVETALSWLAKEKPEVKCLRKEYVADMVAVFIPISWTTSAQPACGIALLPLPDDGVSGPGIMANEKFNMRAFTAIRDGCGLNDITFAHELGHNYGMRHGSGSQSDTLPGNLYRFGRGTDNFEFFTGDKATVMGCIDGLGNGGNPLDQVCDRMPLFSDPNSWLGTGDLQHDNVSVAREQVVKYSGFGEALPPLPSTISCPQ